MSKKCEHNKQKRYCKICDGSIYCQHDIVKYICKACGGKSICKHNIIKATCRECGGSIYCEHDNRKYTCKECKGNGICEHNTYKYECKKCNGFRFCIHKRDKTKCIDCDGSQVCLHRKIKSQCRDCGGSSFCEHDIRKTDCKYCMGSQICIHSKKKSLCVICDGSGFCKHSIRKTLCKECGGSSLCKSEWCETRYNPKYDKYCTRCFIHLFPDSELIKNYKTKEKSVVDFIKTTFPNLDWIHDKIIKDGCSRRRPDLYLDLGYQVIVIEIDENQHEDYDDSCENRRLMEISKDINHRPLIFIRFNPDEYEKLNGEKLKSSWKYTKKGLCVIRDKKEWEMRLNGLKNKVEEWINPNKISNKTVEIIEIFYDEKIAFYLEL